MGLLNETEVNQVRVLINDANPLVLNYGHDNISSGYDIRREWSLYRFRALVLTPSGLRINGRR
jgi:hypothetical protein